MRLGWRVDCNAPLLLLSDRLADELVDGKETRVRGREPEHLWIALRIALRTVYGTAVSCAAPTYVMSDRKAGCSNN